jgi:SAM-dependent methyltransferase
MTENPPARRAQMATAFQQQSVVDRYEYRPPYPAETFEILGDLIRDQPRAVLDVGTGAGDIARPMLAFADRVDAVDWSDAMIAKGRALPGGREPRLRWIQGRMEDVALDPPYALFTAGGSLHWMDRAVVLPRLASMRTAHAYLALVNRDPLRQPWFTETRELVMRYMTNPDYVPVDLIGEIKRRGLFEQVGERTTAPVPFSQTFEQCIESFHSRSYLSRDLMAPEAAAAFDEGLGRVLHAAFPAGMVELQIVGSVVWGVPDG